MCLFFVFFFVFFDQKKIEQRTPVQMEHCSKQCVVHFFILNILVVGAFWKSIKRPVRDLFNIDPLPEAPVV